MSQKMSLNMHICQRNGKALGLEFGLQHQSFVDGWLGPMQDHLDGETGN